MNRALIKLIKERASKVKSTSGIFFGNDKQNKILKVMTDFIYENGLTGDRIGITFQDIGNIFFDKDEMGMTEVLNAIDKYFIFYKETLENE